MSTEARGAGHGVSTEARGAWHGVSTEARGGGAWCEYRS